jgi:hypothetical protein
LLHRGTRRTQGALADYAMVAFIASWHHLEPPSS